MVSGDEKRRGTEWPIDGFYRQQSAILAVESTKGGGAPRSLRHQSGVLVPRFLALGTGRASGSRGRGW
ncbi:hypothetical protein E2562_038876 [Oryza meyeriana var. granulata]|uniref:Uncharacterized protein n=1 Tax=Oryza meyeriana var. granulata TaxID=110450 RepID=A0A6G1CNR3_9ORYZ|nr:hypothetical protein E2562_038876 [Oryza meyeriana var. granulata]